MTDLERFDRIARSRGVLVDTNLLVLLIVGFVNRDRIPLFKRTSKYTPDDWDLLTRILERALRRYSTPHVLAEVNTLTDLPGPEGDVAKAALLHAISLMEEIPIPSLDACNSAYYRRLGLTDAAIVLVARRQGCSVITNDFGLYLALLEQGESVVNFDDLRKLL